MAIGCAFDAQIVVRFTGTSPVVVTESVAPQQLPRAVEGVTRRGGQVVGVDCSVTLVYDVREATGSAVLAQTYRARLRTARLRRGTPYAVNRLGPLIVQLPVDASGVAATSTSASGLETVLPVQAPVASIPLAFRKRLRPEPKTQFAVVSWPRGLPAGAYQLKLAFVLPRARPFREKAIYTASVAAGAPGTCSPSCPRSREWPARPRSGFFRRRTRSTSRSRG